MALEKTIIANVTPEETRMALLEDGRLVEAAVERAESGHIVGNIYLGKVQNVLPGMQAVFVDIGRDRNAFLHVGDMLAPEAPRQNSALSVGRELIVQVAKDALGTKGPRLTTQLALPGRYVVLMPTVDFIGVSRRIPSDTERQRLKELAQQVRPEGMGLIVRTVAEGHSEEELRRDCEYSLNVWQTLSARAKRSNAPTLLYRDVDLVIRIVRDYFTADVTKIVIDNREAYNRVADLLRFVSPELVSRLELYEGSEDVFAFFGLEEELGQLDDRRVELACGGYIVIDRTEALTVIDVNTGKFVGQTRLADTTFQANREAAAEIARQLRLRDIGGIIVIDFIDMEEEQHRKLVLEELTAHLKRDRTRTNVVGITGLGLVEMTRKKVRKDWDAALGVSCPCCDGRGFVRSPETVAIAAVRQLRQLVRGQIATGSVVIQVHPKVAEVLKRPGETERLSRELARSIAVEAVPTMHHEAFAILKGKE